MVQIYDMLHIEKALWVICCANGSDRIIIELMQPPALRGRL